MDKTERKYIALALLLIGLYFTPYFLFGENATIRIQDNLDSNIVWLKLVIDNSLFWSPPDFVFENVLNGVSVSTMRGSYNLNYLFFYSFGIYYGYVICKLTMSLIAFLGTYLLLKNYITQNKLVALSCSLLFALLPFWSFTFTVAGQPLLFYFILNIRENRSKIIDWLYIIFFAFFSSLILSGIFIIILISVIIVADFLQRKKINYRVLIALIVLTTAYSISHFPILYSFLFSNEQFHRVEFVKESLSTKEVFDNFIDIFIHGQYHAHSRHLLMLPFILIAFILSVVNKKIDKRMFYILSFIFSTSIFYAIQGWENLPFLEKLFSYIPLQLDRFYFLYPMLWIILFATSLEILMEEFKKYKHYILCLAFIPSLLFNLKAHELIMNRDSPSFKEFYSVKQFEEIKNTIAEPLKDYRTISIGLHPAIAQYNGLSTLDGYFTAYPLSYKHEFKKIIQGELNKSEELEVYFQNWGSRCYAFSSEIGRNFGHAEVLKPIALDYNFQQFKKMGGNYIISTAIISNNKNIELVKTLKKTEYYWTIHLYRVI